MLELAIYQDLLLDWIVTGHLLQISAEVEMDASSSIQYLHMIMAL